MIGKNFLIIKNYLQLPNLQYVSFTIFTSDLIV